MEAHYVEKHYRRAIKELNGEGKVSIQGMGPQGGLPKEAVITFGTP